MKEAESWNWKGPGGAHRINLYGFTAEAPGAWGHSPGQSPVSHATCFSGLGFFCTRARCLRSGKARPRLPGRAGSCGQFLRARAHLGGDICSQTPPCPFRGRARPGRAVTTEVRSCFCHPAWCEREAWMGDGVQSKSDGFLWTDSGQAGLALLFFDIDSHSVRTAANSKGAESPGS